jgi:hypothetical protein
MCSQVQQGKSRDADGRLAPSRAVRGADGRLAPSRAVGGADHALSLDKYGALDHRHQDLLRFTWDELKKAKAVGRAVVQMLEDMQKADLAERKAWHEDPRSSLCGWAMDAVADRDHERTAKTVWLLRMRHGSCTGVMVVRQDVRAVTLRGPDKGHSAPHVGLEVLRICGSCGQSYEGHRTYNHDGTRLALACFAYLRAAHKPHVVRLVVRAKWCTAKALGFWEALGMKKPVVEGGEMSMFLGDVGTGEDVGQPQPRNRGRKRTLCEE